MRRKMKSCSIFFRTFFAVACVLALAGCMAVKDSRNNPQRPNIIFFFTDDQGWGDLASVGHPYLKTPNLDRLGKEGTRFDQFYSAASVCSPSRTAFMTGHYPARHGIHQHFSNHQHNTNCGMPDYLDPQVTTVTRLLQKSGYHVGHFGKWHLGHTPDAPEPGAYGIDEYRTFGSNGPGWDRNGVPAQSDLAHASYDSCTDEDYFWTHSTELIVEHAIEFMENNKNSGKPFYLNLWALLPHAPNRPTAQQLAKYPNLNANPKDFQSWMRDYANNASDFQAQMKTYCAAITSIDTALGRLLDKLDEMNISDNTLIFFTSDNGPEDYHIGNVKNSGMGSTGIFRGRKRSLYEGGIRMPCIARWPGNVPAGRIDSTSVIGAVDWLPTVCSITGIEIPDIKPDGIDISNILKGTSKDRQEPLFWDWRGGVSGNGAYRPPGLAIRDGNWKLFANPDGSEVELYNIPNDPSEMNNVADRNPNIVAKLLPKLLQWRKTLP